MTISSHSRYTWLLGDYSVNPYSDARSTAFIVTSGGSKYGDDMANAVSAK